VFLGGFGGRDGPPARGAFPRRSGPTQGPNPPARHGPPAERGWSSALRPRRPPSPGGAGLVKRASALAIDSLMSTEDDGAVRRPRQCGTPGNEDHVVLDNAGSRQ
jgi:hypothetical protein